MLVNFSWQPIVDRQQQKSSLGCDVAIVSIHMSMSELVIMQKQLWVALQLAQRSCLVASARSL